MEPKQPAPPRVKHTTPARNTDASTIIHVDEDPPPIMCPHARPAGTFCPHCGNPREVRMDDKPKEK